MADIQSCTENTANQSFIALDENTDFQQLFLHYKIDAVVNAAPFFLSIPLAEAAATSGISYFDLTEDVKSTEYIQHLAASNNDSKSNKTHQIFAPQCGLAPGFVSILASHLTKKFDSLDSVRLRVGALPQYPDNQMLYNLTWSTDGLVNEYCNPCQAIEQGAMTSVPALDSKEEFSLEGIRYEAFNTSGGLGTLPQSLLKKVNQLNYKTIRYPGHRDLMKFLLKDLKFELQERRTDLVKLLDNNIPMTTQDVVLMMVSVAGYRHGKYEKITDVRRIYHNEIFGQELSAIQITTAASVCAVIEMWQKNTLPNTKFLRQEDISYQQFCTTHYGRLLIAG